MSKWIKYKGHPIKAEDMAIVSESYFKVMNNRRSVRVFSDKKIPREVLENIIRTASTAPSGAHKQPWTFCVVSNPNLKKQIRQAAEKEEYINYNGRMSEDWLKDLQHFDTDWHKEFLETAPYLIIVFKKTFDIDEKGKKSKNYYVNESVGIACGILITAIHQAGLATLTHTPSPMNFLQKLLNRPNHERPFLLMPVGFPAHDAKVPDLKRKPLNDVSIWYD
jgi:nitroreductase